MNYVELNIAVSDALQAEILTAQLADYPFESFLTEDGALKAYIPQKALDECKASVDAMLDDCGAMRRSYLALGAEDWNAPWESGFTPVEIEGRLRIRAPHHAPAPEGMPEVIVMPCLSFGTGHHATTYLMVSALLDLGVEGRCGLDMGSGTGVLAIVAAGRGAASVDAVDTDEWADRNCRDNAAANGVADRVHPLLGDVSRVAGRRYDFVLANINRNVLTASMPAYAALLSEGGDLLLSGFFEADVPKVEASAAGAGFAVAEVRTREGWAMIRCKKGRTV